MNTATLEAKVQEAAQSDVGNRPAEGRITDEAVAAARAMIGLHLRPEGPYLQDATADTLRNWCNGIGDLNPLYRDVGYGASTRYGSVVATGYDVSTTDGMNEKGLVANLRKLAGLK